MSKETSDRTEVVGRLRSQVEELRFFVGHTEATMRRQLMSAQSSSSCHKLFKRAVA